MHNIVVQKFGGTSLGSNELIMNAARIVVETKKSGVSPVVVVSAMAGVTDNLLNQISYFAKDGYLPCMAEQDSILAAGEQIAAGLMAIALSNLGIKVRSWLGWQVPISTDAVFGSGKIEYVEKDAILMSLESGETPVIAGFQGVHNNRIVTIGRGGGDTTAAAVAASIGASRCDIFTDVPGVLSADPRIVPNAKHIQYLTYEEILEMASSGAKVVHPRAIEIAMRHNTPIRILSSFEPEGCTTVIMREDKMIEHDMVTGISCTNDQVRFTLEDIENVPGIAAAIFTSLEEQKINADIIVQNVSRDQTYCDLTFTTARQYKDAVLAAVKKISRVVFKNITIDENIAKVSIIGIGLKKYSGIAQKMFQILAEHGINIVVISSSEVKISVLIQREYMELAVRCLHQGFGLDQQ
jgi:aspartate kinase